MQISQIERKFTELVELLFRDNSFPYGAFRFTSTGSWARCVHDAPRIGHLLKLGLAAEAAGANRADPTKTL